MQITRVALSARIGSGKTTLANRLREEHGFERLAFGDYLRADLARALGIKEQELLEDKVKFREAMQFWGELRRKLDPDYWIDSVLYGLEVHTVFGEPLAQESSRLVVDDMRYHREAKALRAVGFHLIRLECPPGQSLAYLLDQGMDQRDAELAIEHVSETELQYDYSEPWDKIIHAPRTRPLDSIYEELTTFLNL